jgi:hypothetical protein
MEKAGESLNVFVGTNNVWKDVFVSNVEGDYDNNTDK